MSCHHRHIVVCPPQYQIYVYCYLWWKMVEHSFIFRCYTSNSPICWPWLFHQNPCPTDHNSEQEKTCPRAAYQTSRMHPGKWCLRKHRLWRNALLCVQRCCSWSWCWLLYPRISCDNRNESGGNPSFGGCPTCRSSKDIFFGQWCCIWKSLHKSSNIHSLVHERFGVWDVWLPSSHLIQEEERYVSNVQGVSISLVHEPAYSQIRSPLLRASHLPYWVCEPAYSQIRSPLLKASISHTGSVSQHIPRSGAHY